VTNLAAAFAAIDAANAGDPTSFLWDGAQRPLAQLQGERATHWLARLAPDATHALQIAARGHHLRRFALARSSYPEGRAGYLVWRRDQKKAHAAALQELLIPVGFSPETVDRASTIVQKIGLGTDPEVQTFEDVVCLVFLETQYDELLARGGEPLLENALRKTMAKMSAAGTALALDATPSGAGRDLLIRVASGAT
jgi:hypothetical protein